MATPRDVNCIVTKKHGGRTAGARRARANDPGERLDDAALVKKYGGAQEVQARMAVMAQTRSAQEALGTVQHFSKTAGRGLAGRAVEGLMTIRMANMLSGFKTFVMNQASTGVMTLAKLPQRFVSVAVYQGQGLPEAWRQTADLWAGNMAGMQKGLSLARNDMAISFRGTQAQANARDRLAAQELTRMYEAAQRQTMDEGIAHARKVGLPQGVVNQYDNAIVRGIDMGLDNFATAPLKAQRAADMWWKAINYEGEARRLASKAARADLGDMAGDPVAYRKAMQERVEFHMRNPDEATQKHLAEYMHEATFTNTPVGWVQGYQRAVLAHPALRLVTPFVVVPANVVTAGLKWTPFLGRMLKTTKAALREGGEAAADVKAKEAVGGAIELGIVTPLILSGRITGAEPANPRERAIWKNMGYQPYSVKIGGIWFDYKQVLGPYAVAIGAAVNAKKALMAAVTEDEVAAATGLIMAAKGLLGYAVSETFVGDMLEFGELVADPATTEQKLFTFSRRMAETFVPYASLTRQVSRVQAGGRRYATRASGGEGRAGSIETSGEGGWEMLMEEVDTFNNRVMNEHFRFLGAGAEQFPELDHHGEQINYYAGVEELTGIGGSVLGFLSPAAFRYESTDPLDIFEADVGFGPGRWDANVVVKEGKMRRYVELNPEELHYLSKHAGEAYKKAATQVMEAANKQGFNADTQPEIAKVLRNKLTSIRGAARQATLARMQQQPKKFPALHEAMEVQSRIMDVQAQTEARDMRERRQ